MPARCSAAYLARPADTPRCARWRFRRSAAQAWTGCWRPLTRYCRWILWCAPGWIWTRAMAPPWPCCTSSAACYPRVTRRIAWWWRRRSRNRWNGGCARGSADPVSNQERPHGVGTRQAGRSARATNCDSHELWKTLSKSRLVVREGIVKSYLRRIEPSGRNSCYRLIGLGLVALQADDHTGCDLITLGCRPRRRFPQFKRENSSG